MCSSHTQTRFGGIYKQFFQFHCVLLEKWGNHWSGLENEMRSNCSLKMHAFAAYCQTVTESGVKHLSFVPHQLPELTQTHVHWQRRSRVENQTEASQNPLQDLRSCPRAQRRQFLEPKDSLGAKKPPSGKNSRNLHSYRKITRSGIL